MKKELKSISVKKVEGGSEVTTVEFIPNEENLQNYIQEKMTEYAEYSNISTFNSNYERFNFSIRTGIIPDCVNDNNRLIGNRIPHIKTGNTIKIYII